MTAQAAAAAPELRTFVDSVRRCCAAELPASPRSRDAVTLPRALWWRLGALGALGLGGDGDAVWLAAAYRELGAALCPGPLVGAAMAPVLLGDRVAVDGVRAGELLVSVGDGEIFPWGGEADVVVAVAADGEEAWLVDPAAPRRPMATLAREPWARIAARTARVESLGDARRAAAVGDAAVAALLLGAASRLAAMSAHHAAARHQFGRAIGSFQGVAFPIAAGHVALHNAGCLLDVAVASLDAGDDARALCSAARAVAASAALDVASTAHQVHGAMGFVEESPVGAYSARIRQWSLLPPPAAGGDRALLASIGIDPHSEDAQ